MENKVSVIKKAVSSFKFTLIAQIVALVLSVAKSIILPKILPVEDYGYWQIYVLYSTYVGMFMLGYNDGVYLIYGKYQYNELPFRKLRAADRWYISMLLLFSIAIGAFCGFTLSSERKFAMMAVSIDIFLMGINGLLIYVLQITNQMKAYSFYTILDKIVLLGAIILILLTPSREYRSIIVADVVSKLIVSIGLLIKCKEMFIGNTDSIAIGFREFAGNIKVGINLMFAQLVGQFITGIGRFIIDVFGNIEEYAYYSFGITITNLVLVFITAVSLVLYPTLKRLPEKEYKRYFETLNFSVVIFGFLAIGLYFPGVVFVKTFLPKYTPILSYLHILFCVIILQAKVQLVINTFYKVLREERAMLKANILCIIAFFVIALVLFIPTKNIIAIAVCTLIATMIRCFYSEMYLRRKMEIERDNRIIFEILFVICFTLAGFSSGLLTSIIIYLAMLSFAVVLYRSVAKGIISDILKLRNK